MRFSIVLALMLLAAPAFAQNVRLDVTVAEATTLVNALGERPWKDVNPLMQKLIAELNEQMAPKPEAPKKEQPPPAEDKK